MFLAASTMSLDPLFKSEYMAFVKTRFSWGHAKMPLYVGVNTTLMLCEQGGCAISIGAYSYGW